MNYADKIRRFSFNKYRLKYWLGLFYFTLFTREFSRFFSHHFGKIGYAIEGCFQHRHLHKLHRLPSLHH